jgi:hypothetical protein
MGMADPQSTVVAVKDTIGALGGGFMISREAKALCGQTGLGPRELYFRGRCGVLGEVHTDVVLAACVFFPADHVRESWEGGRSLPAEKAAAMYAGACQDWGRRRLGSFDGAARLAELLERVVANADVLGAPLFAGWRAVPLPDDPPGRAAQLLHVAREFRGGKHAVATLACGIDPLMSSLASTRLGAPSGRSAGHDLARFLMWPEPYPEPGEADVAARRRAEEMTDALVAPAFGVLSDTESDELIDLLGQARTA